MMTTHRMFTQRENHKKAWKRGRKEIITEWFFFCWTCKIVGFVRSSYTPLLMTSIFASILRQNIRRSPSDVISIRNFLCKNRHFSFSRPPGPDFTKHRDTFWSCKLGNSDDDRNPAANCNDGHSQDGKKIQRKGVRGKLRMIRLVHESNNIWLDFEASPVQIKLGILRILCLRLVDMQLTKARLVVIYAYL